MRGVPFDLGVDPFQLQPQPDAIPAHRRAYPGGLLKLPHWGQVRGDANRLLFLSQGRI